MASEALNKVEWQAGISLATIYVLRMLGLFMVIPVIAVAALEYPDYSPLWVGLAVGGYGLTQAIFQIPLGVLSDKFGRKPIIVIGLILFSLGSLIAGLADSMWLLTIGRILQGSGAIAGAIMALASDVTRESQRTKVMAIIGISIGFSFYLALLLGPVIATDFGLKGIFLITSGLALLCVPILLVGVPSSRYDQPTGDALPRLEQIGGLAKDPRLWRLNVSVLSIHLLITCFFVQIPVALQNVGIPLSGHWEIYSYILLASMLVLIVLIRATEKLQLGLSFRIAILLMLAAFFLLLTQSSSWIGLVIAGILFFGGFNFLEAKMPALVSSVSPAGRKGSAMGLYASFQFFGAFLGGLLSGLLNSYFSFEAAFIMCLIILFLLSLIVRGLQSVEKVKRVTIKLKQTSLINQSSVDLKRQLEALDGIKEVVIDVLENAVYLKVDAKRFDLYKAQQLL